MSFKVEIEIIMAEEKHCGRCHINLRSGMDYCPIFGTFRDYDNNEAEYLRCPECLEAEKIYWEELCKDRGEISDGTHTFNELYEFRKLYNAALFNVWAKLGLYDVHKSLRHNEGEECFGGGWFIVVAVLPTGQISNHYKIEDWDLFKIPDLPLAKYPYDGHTSCDVTMRLTHLLKGDQNAR